MRGRGSMIVRRERGVGVGVRKGIGEEGMMIGVTGAGGVTTAIGIEETETGQAKIGQIETVGTEIIIVTTIGIEEGVVAAMIITGDVNDNYTSERLSKELRRLIFLQRSRRASG